MARPASGRRSSSHQAPRSRDEILTLKEVAAYLKLDPKSIYRLAWDGRIPAFKAGAAWRFRARDLDAWIESQMNGQRRRSGSARAPGAGARAR